MNLIGWAWLLSQSREVYQAGERNPIPASNSEKASTR
jgi:hypothetical protein